MFGIQLKKMRQKVGISQRELGERMGVTQQSIAQYEKAEGIPKLATLKKIAGALNVPVYALTNPEWEKHPIEAIAGDYAARKYENLIDCLDTLGCSIVEDHDNETIWIKFPDSTIQIIESDLDQLENDLFTYLQFKLEELQIKYQQ